MDSPLDQYYDVLFFGRGLEKLESRWRSYVEEKQSRGLMERTRRLFQSKHEYDYDQLSRSLSNSLKQLRRNWCFLQIFVGSIHSCDAPKEIQFRIENLLALVREIRTDIFGDGTSSTRAKYYSKRPHKLLNLVIECQRKTDELCNSEIRNALEEFSNFTFHWFSDDYDFWEGFVPCVAENLQSIKDAGYGDISKQVGFLLSELKWVQMYPRHSQTGLGRRDEEISRFRTLLVSTVMRIAFQSCDFWFNRTEPEIAKVKATVLLDLHRKIDPTHPEVLELNLRFQEALYKTKTASYASKCLRDFCSYLLMWMVEEYLTEELISLVTFYFKTTLKDGDDVQSFFAEIKAVLGEAASFHRTAQREQLLSHPAYHTELVTKVCLLKAEFFLREQLDTSTSLMLFSDDQFFKVDTFLTNLRAFTKYLCGKQNTEYLRQSSALAEELCNEVQSLHISFQSERITNSFTKHSLLQLLFKIFFFKAESFLTELLKSSDSLISHEKYQIGSLVEELKYFKRIIKNKLARETSEEKLVISQVEAVTREIIFVSYSFLPENDKLNNMIRSLPQLLDKVKIVNIKLRDMSQQFPMSIFPKTYGLGFIDFLGRNIRELLIYDPESIALVKRHIMEVQLHLEYLKIFLMKVKDYDFEQGQSKDLADHIIHVSYKLEYVIESIEVDGYLQQSLQQSLWLYDLLEDIRVVHEQVSKTHEMPCAGRVQNLPLISCDTTSRDTEPTVDEMVVDLGDEEEAIIDRLTRGSYSEMLYLLLACPVLARQRWLKKCSTISMSFITSIVVHGVLFQECTQKGDC